MSMSCISNVGSSNQEAETRTVHQIKTSTSVMADLSLNDVRQQKSVMKTGSFGASIHYVKPSGGGKGGGLAVKKYSVDTGSLLDENGDDLLAYISHEVSTMNMLRHDNVLPCLGSLVVGREVWLVTPLMEYGSVSSLLARPVSGGGFPDGLPEMVCCFVLRDVLRALAYVHRQGVVHRSVRCSHILVDGAKGGAAVLSGFRYSTRVHAITNRGSGGEQQHGSLYDYPLHSVTSNLFWLAPEILKQNLLGYTETSDIYSLGVASCEMANGVVPYSDFPTTLMLIEKLRGSSPRLLDFATLSAAAAANQQQQLEDQQQLQEEGEGGHHHQFPVAGGNKPVAALAADSGIAGSTVGSWNNMLPLGKNSTFYSREFSPQFHDFVAECTISCGDERPGAADLLQHPWIRQLKKTPATLLTLLCSVKPVTEAEAQRSGGLAASAASSREEVDMMEDDDSAGLIVEQMQSLVMNTENNMVSWDFEDE